MSQWRTDCAIVKVALLNEHSRLEDEVKIYTHLNAKGVVDCIPDVLGIFKMTEFPYLLLVTRDAGLSLAKQKARRKAPYVIIQPLSLSI